MLIIQYFLWHYLAAPKEILKIWRNFLIFFWHFFSIGLLFRTFFSPWRRLVLVKRAVGFDIKEFADRIFANLLARFFGALLRSAVILFGLLVESAVLVLGPLFLLIWIFLPLFLIGFIRFGFSGIVISLIIVLLLIRIFFKSYLKQNPWLLFGSIKSLKIEEENFGYLLDAQSTKIIHEALGELLEKQADKLFKGLLKTEEVGKIISRLGLEKSKIQLDSRISLNDLLKNALILARTDLTSKTGKSIRISPGDLFSAFVVLEPDFLSSLSREAGFGKDIKPEDVLDVSAWIRRETEAQEEKKRFWTLDYLLRISGLAKDWAYGFTNTLDRFSFNLTAAVSSQNIEYKLIIYGKAIEAIEQILARAGENNTLLIGEPGVGKREAVLGFTYLVAHGKILPVLEHKRVIELELNSLLAGIQSPGDLKERILRVFNEVEKAGNIILVIDNFHNLVLSGVLDAVLSYLGSRNFQVIGLTDYGNYHKHIEPNSALLKFFEKIEIPELSQSQTLFILENIVSFIEKRAGVLVTYQALKEIIDSAELYIQDTPFPEKAVDLLDEVVVYAATKTKDKIVLPAHVHQLVSLKTGIPTGKITEEAKKELVNLEEEIHRVIINQDEAVKVVADALRRARTGLSGKDRPIGAFLFLGPTGVGKTSLVRALSKIYFGKEERIIRLDMTEFKEDASISNLIGSFKEEKPGILTSAVRERPYTVVLLDEIEKCSKSILNLFLELLDEGRMRDALGRVVSFRNTIIIATSNAGAELIRTSIKEGKDLLQIKAQILDALQSEGVFKPEFLNRFDAVVLFKPLSQEHLLSIAQLMLESLNKRLEKEHESVLVITQELKQKIVELGYDPVYGARPMRRVIQDKIENQIAKKILKGELKKGERIIIKPEGLGAGG
ncbi:MAG: hypothetical protein A3A94_00880 [Candidatus Portnoybacteria bacterium RIFCSPLOWO2_01_FULL_43_11]|uniref:Clp R domain-containing protein n=2 Tax=Candidatus Portnoyibacteriota TaxID=1817913 RepID=A0A1G2FD60_9BACT|nr:MAG: hypothetical protein A2815_00535 [Candidatus Portnoybacteria bacterium RIFCSPHIGHO2_01_FULL_40_12b]OGZ36264.1 MAG: hypothetical protein A3D38_01170 [Candidatus Portnoybacteria bacterium RIFCSPHIGHO2_02_FULL_40_23]OGZ38637.1 MAG: hypothetical protein A3A94_00880 [Candidatus Portnoybacteria bacterium RIFCSPLOWO2_01_FULL_43_11]